MIIDKLSNASLYKGISPRLAEAFDYLRSVDPDSLKQGRNEIHGDDLYAMMNVYNTTPREKGKWEAHRKYIDVQYLVEGVEQMGVTDIANLKVTKDYDAEGDYMLFEGDGPFIRFTPGMFGVYLPHDAHMPNTAIGDPAPAKKIVVKVRV